MRMFFATCSCIVLRCLIAVDSATAAGTVIAEHSGSVDPVTSGFSHDRDHLGAGFLAAAEASPEAHWHLQQADTARNNYRFALNPADLASPLGWTATGRFSADFTGVSNQNAHFQVTDATDAWVVALLSNGPAGAGAYGWNNGYNSTAATLLASLDITKFHTYQMIYDPSANGGGGAVRFYVDGLDTGVVQSRSDVNADGPNRFVFGDNTNGGGDSDQRWALARFETGQNLVPEPSTICCLAAIALLSLSRRFIR
jgi:hypothetical protein